MKWTLIAFLFITALAARAEDPIRPDPKLTPGDVLTNVTVEQIMQKGYANKLNGGVRHVTAAEKKQVFTEYFGKVPGMQGHYEIALHVPNDIVPKLPPMPRRDKHTFWHWVF